MGFPAARVGDMHLCPMINPGPSPHIGGPILPIGCRTVLIGNMPAARVGDKASCCGPSDVIVRGSTSVMIGGKFAARQLDTTAHGGTIIMGCFNVLIGGFGMGGAAGGASTGAQAAAFQAAAKDGTPLVEKDCSSCLQS